MFLSRTSQLWNSPRTYFPNVTDVSLSPNSLRFPPLFFWLINLPCLRTYFLTESPLAATFYVRIFLVPRWASKSVLLIMYASDPRLTLEFNVCPSHSSPSSIPVVIRICYSPPFIFLARQDFVRVLFWRATSPRAHSLSSKAPAHSTEF